MVEDKQRAVKIKQSFREDAHEIVKYLRYYSPNSADRFKELLEREMNIIPSNNSLVLH